MTDRRTTLARADEALKHVEAKAADATECEKRLARGYYITRVSTTFSQPQYTPLILKTKIGYLVEECGEVLHVIGKLTRYGEDAYDPTVPVEKRETNGAALLRELRDLKRAIEIVEATMDAERPDPLDSFNAREGL